MTDTLSPNQAAKRCAVSVRTVRRWLAADMLEGAYRDEEGLWHIPPSALLSRLPTSTPPPAPSLAVPSDAAELERVNRELARVTRELVAERYANELLSKNLEDVRLALRALAAGPPITPPSPTPTGAEVVEGSTERAQNEDAATRRRWWQRG